MDPIQESFEKDLLSKLQFKASSNVSIETALTKIFKFFDLNNSGEVRKPEFMKAIAKAGVVLNDQDITDHLFKLYSSNQQTINYKEFVQQLTGEKPQQQDQTQLGQCITSAPKDFIKLKPARFLIPEVVDRSSIIIKMNDRLKLALELIKTKISLRGCLGLLNFAKGLRTAQSTNCLSSQQFFQVLREQKIDIDNNAQIIIFMQADRNQSGNATWDDLIGIIKGQLPIYRATLIKQVFESFGSIEVPFSYLINRYHAERHPDTRHHNKRPEELREEFVIALETYQFLTKKSYFDINTFVEFYHYFGFHINNDEVFRSVMVSVWDLDSTNSPPKVVSKAHVESQQQPYIPPLNKTPQRPQQQQYPAPTDDRFDTQSQASRVQSQAKPQESRSQQSRGQGQQQQDLSPHSRASQSIKSQNSVSQLRQVELIVQRIKNRLATRGAKGFISMYRAFKMGDTDKDGLLTITEFRKAVRDHRIDVTDQEIDLVFSYFDRDMTGLIDLWGILFVLKGEMNAQRVAVAEAVFSKLSKDQQDVVTLADLKSNFHARNHPEVRSGKRQDDDVSQDFFDSIQMLHHINGGFGNELYSREELMEYMSNFSASIQDDKYFEQILQQTFRLGTETNLHTNYAGGGKKVFEPDHKKGYLQDHHRYVVSGGSVAANAPFGTFAEASEPSVKSRPQTGYQQSASFNIFKPLDEKVPKNVVSQAPPPIQYQPAEIQAPPTPIPQNVNVQIQSNGRKSDPVLQIRSRLSARGIRGLIAIQKKLRNFDRSHLGTVTYPEFLRVFADLRIQIADQTIKEAFRQFEVEESGVMNYDGFVKSLQGTMTQRKFNIIVTAFDSLTKSNTAASYEVIRDSFNPKNHPEVKQNRRREEEVLGEFLDTFEDNHRLFVTIFFHNSQTGVDHLSDPTVSFEEFINYYNNFNALIEDEGQFEQVILGVWPGKRF